MEVEKLFKISAEYFSDYLRVLLTTIRSPKIEFQPIELQIENSIVTQCPDSRVTKARLNPKLIIFLLTSIFIGSTLNANVPGRNPAPELVVAMVIVIACWFLFSVLIYVICKVFAGRGTFIHTLSMNLQVLAVIYVLSGFSAFLWGVVITGLHPETVGIYLRGGIAETLIKKPINMYFVVQCMLILIYLPWANKRVHGFKFLVLRRMRIRGAFPATLSLAETTLFFITFLIITTVIVSLSTTSYHLHNVPLDQPETNNFRYSENIGSIALSQPAQTIKPRRQRLIVKDSPRDNRLQQERTSGNSEEKPLYFNSLAHVPEELRATQPTPEKPWYYVDKDGNARGYPGVHGW